VLRVVRTKKLCTQVFFQFLDRALRRRLLEVQSLSRTSEVEFFGNSHKAAKVPKLHRVSSPEPSFSTYGTAPVT
jgi:hypothetical protein